MNTDNGAPTQFLATAFVSCSLRSEDKPFIEFVEQILINHQLLPFGTVGRYSAAPENPVLTMRANIPKADIIVIVATPRYAQEDVHSGLQSRGIPEMLHVESGIAFANDKPIVVFVQKGVSVGSFLPNVTQYITLDGSPEDYSENQYMIYDLLNNAYLRSLQAKQKRTSASTTSMLTAGLAFWGGMKILESLTEAERPKRKRR
jgi:hypothetical protein